MSASSTQPPVAPGLPEGARPFSFDGIKPGDTVLTEHGAPRRFIAGPSPCGRVVLENAVAWYLQTPETLYLPPVA